MVRIIVGRVATAAVSIFILLTALFFILRATTDPVTAQLGGLASATEIAQAKRALGYDDPLIVQFGRYIGQVFRGDLGQSSLYGIANTSVIAQRLPYTAALLGVTVIFVVVVAFPLGALAGMRRHGFVDRFLLPSSALGQAIPSFVVAQLCILLFAVWLGWLPASGAAGFTSVILPALTLAVYPISQLARILRNEILDAQAELFVTAARARGVTPATLALQYLLRGALTPVVTVIASESIALLGGTVIVESVYGWPGMGSLVVQSLKSGDFSLALAIVALIAAVAIVINLLADISYTVIDPRVRLGRQN
jgi:peptide/nickel transport system permease protein